MNIYRILVIAGLLVIISGCYVPIAGRVIDAETQQPVEGAVVLVEWTKTHGYGDHWTESYKVVEAVSDKDGKIKVKGCYSPNVNPPHVTVYKKGYVAWSNQAIFPSYQKRVNFAWSSQTFKLEKFDGKPSYDAHVDFIRFSINSSLNIEKKMMMYDAFEWERDLAFQERSRKDVRP